MKNLKYILVAIAIFLSFSTIALSHEGEDHGDEFHVDVMHVMESGFHGKLDGKVVEVVLAPNATIEKDGKAIPVSDLAVGDSVMIAGAKMPGNKIGATKVVVDKSGSDDHSKHKKHGMPMDGEIGAEHKEHMDMGH